MHFSLNVTPHKFIGFGSVNIPRIKNFKSSWITAAIAAVNHWPYVPNWLAIRIRTPPTLDNLPPLLLSFFPLGLQVSFPAQIKKQKTTNNDISIQLNGRDRGTGFPGMCEMITCPLQWQHLWAPTGVSSAPSLSASGGPFNHLYTFRGQMSTVW